MHGRGDPLLRVYRTILSLAGACVGLLAVTIYLALRPSPNLTSAAALRDSEVRRQVIARLVAESEGIFDSHVDADVGRVHQPRLENRKKGEILVSTNDFGMRERDYELPKPDDTVRVVLLGDSMIFGFGVAAEDRLGNHLETWLGTRSPDFSGRVECLHLGVSSWNVRSEAAFLRRQLSELRPDLVIHVIVPNDVEDTVGTRGFGGKALFSPQHPEHADSWINAGFPQRFLGFGRSGHLRRGLDHESRSRYHAAAREIRRLAGNVERSGSEYRLVVSFRDLLPLAHQLIGRHLPRNRITYLSQHFSTDPKTTLGPGDSHWNGEGHRMMARLLYGLIARDNLLPRLRPSPWAEAAQAVAEIAGAGRREAEGVRKDDQAARRISSSLDMAELDAATAAQIHGGIDKEGRVSPYASFLLRNPDGERLRIEGSTLPRPELDGARVRIFADAEELGEIVIEAGSEIDLTYPLPAAVADIPLVSIRFEADDYVYAGLYLQHCVVFRLKRLAIESGPGSGTS